MKCADCGAKLILPAAKPMVVSKKQHGGGWSPEELKWFCAPSCNKRVARGDRQ